MSLPHLLLVDDSEAVLAFGKAALAGHYSVSTAMTGSEWTLKQSKLARISSLPPTNKTTAS